MIHTIILNMLDPYPDNGPLKRFINDSEDSVHPVEVKMIEEILKCIEIHRDIRTFINSHATKRSNVPKKGLYLEALANGIDLALDPFREQMLELERKHIKNLHLPISHFLAEIKKFEIFFNFLKQFIDELQIQKYHGCAILGHLHKYNFHADVKSMEALKVIRRRVHSVFLQQLSQWLIYGRLVDVYDEFFIIRTGDKGGKSKHSRFDDGITTSGSTMGSEVANNSHDLLWQFQIVYSAVPSNLTTSFAEKVLFIGQTVRMLIDEPQQSAKKVSVWSDDDDQAIDVESLWNNQEHLFFNKIQMLHNCNGIDIGAYEQVVNEIKLYVTERLSEIAFNQADLIKHLRLFKDYYLLGRGELFLEFISQFNKIKTTDGTNLARETLARDVNQAFQKALSQSTSIDSEHPTMHLIIDDNADVSNPIINKMIRLNFNVKWPLHLFFSPLVLDRYGELFSFLLQIRQIQYDLHLVWHMHREKKVTGNSVLSQLRNKMLFLIDNLQYYLQVDVLESQFCALINAVQNSKDFECIQRAHSVFQANILSLSFLLNSGNFASAGASGSGNGDRNDGNDTTHSTNRQNPVLTILDHIFTTIQSFCRFNQNIEETSQNETQELGLLEEQFSKNIHELMKLLSNRMAGPASEPLSQLLLRLDFNYWFSRHST